MNPFDANSFLKNEMKKALQHAQLVADGAASDYALRQVYGQKIYDKVQNDLACIRLKAEIKESKCDN